MAPTKKQEPTPSDATFARSLLFHNDSARHLKSWLTNDLNGATSAEAGDEEDELDIEGDEEEHGLGFQTPKANPHDRTTLSANDQLRKQLLNKQFKSSSKISQRLPNRHLDGLSASKPRPQNSKRSALSANHEDDDDDDEAKGRMSTKKAAVAKLKGSSSKENDLSSKELPGRASSKKRATSYLDEILAQRQNKKTKSQKGKTNTAVEND